MLLKGTIILIILTFEHSDIKGIGGVKTNIREVNKELARRGHKCIVITANRERLPSKEYYNGYTIIRVGKLDFYGINPSTMSFIKADIENIKPDIVHIHGYRSLFSFSCAALLKHYKIPMVFSPHYDRLGYNTFAGKYLMRFYNPLGKRIFDWSNKIICNTEYSKSILIEDFKLNTNKIVVIPHGVNNIKYYPKAYDKKNTIKLLYIGVLIELKGVQFIIQAIAELQAMGQKAILTIIGDGIYKSELLKLAKTLGVENNIIFLGPLFGPELNKKIVDADIFLLLSRNESYGIVVAEALALGTPCIVTTNTALIEFLKEPGCFGVAYPPDPKEVAQLILKIYKNNIQAGPVKNIKKWSTIAVYYEKVYQEVL